MPDLQKVIKALERRGFLASLFKTAKEAKAALLDSIPSDASVGIGGSTTLYDMGVIDALYERGNRVLCSVVAKREGTDPDKARRDAMLADVFLSSTNALTEQGELYNTDMIGNRVAAMFYGPDKVIVVAGRNKIVKNRSAASKRVREVASPLNTKRLKKDTPCAKTGHCADCDSPDRICRITVIHEWAPPGKDIHVMLVDEDLGF